MAVPVRHKHCLLSSSFTSSLVSDISSNWSSGSIFLTKGLKLLSSPQQCCRLFDSKSPLTAFIQPPALQQFLHPTHCPLSHSSRETHKWKTFILFHISGVTPAMLGIPFWISALTLESQSPSRIIYPNPPTLFRRWVTHSGQLWEYEDIYKSQIDLNVRSLTVTRARWCTFPWYIPVCFVVHPLYTLSFLGLDALSTPQLIRRLFPPLTSLSKFSLDSSFFIDTISFSDRTFPLLSKYSSHLQPPTNSLPRQISLTRVRSTLGMAPEMPILLYVGIFVCVQEVFSSVRGFIYSILPTLVPPRYFPALSVIHSHLLWACCSWGSIKLRSQSMFFLCMIEHGEASNEQGRFNALAGVIGCIACHHAMVGRFLTMIAKC